MNIEIFYMLCFWIAFLKSPVCFILTEPLDLCCTTPTFQVFRSTMGYWLPYWTKKEQGALLAHINFSPE